MTPDAPGQRDTLTELARQAERILDSQIKASEEQDDKTEQALSIALVILGGAGALINLTTAGFSGDLSLWPMLVLQSGGIAEAGWAFWYFASVYVGIGGWKSRYFVGWDANELARVAKDGRYSVEEVLAAHIEQAPDWISKNMATLEAATRRRQAGMLHLMGSASLLALAFIYLFIGHGLAA